MFINDVREIGVPDLDQVNKSHFTKRIRYRQMLKEELRRRFRIQYLGQLSRRTKCKNNFTQVAVGDIVLVENDTQKRLDWPLARVEEAFPGKDGHIRVVKLRTARGELIRPIQRLIPLEVERADEDTRKIFGPSNTLTKTVEEPESDPEEEPPREKGLTTRSGRLVRKPKRF